MERDRRAVADRRGGDHRRRWEPGPRRARRSTRRVPSATPGSRDPAEHGARGSRFPCRGWGKTAEGVGKLVEYKGYFGTVEPDDGVFAGRVSGLRNVITFEGATFAEVDQAFRDSIDDYLAFCAERGEPPDRPYSGKIPFRVSPETHRRANARSGGGYEPQSMDRTPDRNRHVSPSLRCRMRFDLDASMADSTPLSGRWG